MSTTSMGGLEAASASTAAHPGRSAWTGLAASLRLWGKRLRERAELARMDDWALKDIGLTRAEADQEARKWPWQG
jgi:uncharacterized protein YjiS (DUF1127 family)